MKKQVISEQRVCDVKGCGKRCYDGCLACGVDHCYSHKRELGTEYHFSTQYGGHGDGYYCRQCDALLKASGNDPLHVAYLEMKALRKERDAFYKSLEKRNKRLSLRIEALYDKRRKAIDDRKA